MTFPKSAPFLTCLAILLFAAGCQPAEQSPAADTPAQAADAEAAAPPAAETVDADAAPADSGSNATDASSVVERSAADALPPGFDARALAGRFAGTLPCADCPGIDTTLELRADGSYSLQEQYQERDTTFDSAGTWLPSQDGKALLLDPEDKDGADRFFELVSNDELRMLDSDGNSIDSQLDYSLRRQD